MVLPHYPSMKWTSLIMDKKKQQQQSIETCKPINSGTLSEQQRARGLDLLGCSMGVLRVGRVGQCNNRQMGGNM